VVGEQLDAEPPGVVGGTAQLGIGGPDAGRAADGDEHGRERGAEDAGADHDGQRPLTRDGLDAQVLGPVDTQQHDHEQEQDDDGARIDDHLHGGEERGLQ
jgi:hypothetical protein